MFRKKGSVINCARKNLKNFLESDYNLAQEKNDFPNDAVKKIVLSENEIDTLSPYAFFTFTKLRSLNLDHNNLSDLPIELSQLTSLKKLNISFNAFNAIPTSVLELTQLQSLNVQNNRIYSVPDEIKTLKQLTSLNVQHNRLTKLPNSLTELSLSKLKVVGNPLVRPPMLM